MSLLRKYPRMAKASDLHRNPLLSPPHLSRLARKQTFSILTSTCNHVSRDFTKEVKHLRLVRFYSSSNRNTFKAEAPVGIFEEAQNSLNLSSLGGRLGQSFYRLSRHINIYFKRKDVVPLAENACFVVTTPDHLGRSQRRNQSQRAAREQKISEGKDRTQLLKCNEKQENSETSPSTKGNTGLQLFHISSLATTFGESYSYVANHINSVFSHGFAKPQVQESVETMSSSRRTNRRQKRKTQSTYIMNSKEAKTSQEKLGADQAAVEPHNSPSSWEEGYLLFARHVNKYFGAKVTDEADQHGTGQVHVEKKQFSAQSASKTQGVMSQPKKAEPITFESRGLFHSSHNTTNFGENYFQMARHINQYFKGQSVLDEDIDRNLRVEMDPGSVTSERLKMVSFMDCLRHPTSAIPDLLGAYLKLGPLTQPGKPKPAVMSPPGILNKKVS